MRVSEKILQKYRPLLKLESVVSHGARLTFKKIGVYSVFVVLIVLLISKFSFSINLVLYGIIVVFITSTFSFYLLDFFFYSQYIRLKEKEVSFPLAVTLDHILDEGEKTHSLSSVVSLQEDVGVNFCMSFFGYHVLARLGINYDRIDFSDVREITTLEKIEKDPDFINIKNLSDYCKILFKNSLFFSSLVRRVESNEQDVASTADWIEKQWSDQIDSERWWSRKSLARVPGIGKDWAYGQTHLLQRYGLFLDDSGQAEINPLYSKEIENLEAVLSRSQSANALILSDSDSSRMAVIENLNVLIGQGHSHPTIEHKKIFIFHSARFSQAYSSASDFSYGLSQILHQAVKAGNVIFVIDDFASFIQNTTSIGVTIAPLLTPYLRSDSLQMIGLVDTSRYHAVVESHKDIVEHFELIRIETKDRAALLDIAEQKAYSLENKYRIIFTFQSIQSAVQSAEQYFSSEPRVDKINDLLLEVAPIVASKSENGSHPLVMASDILACVESKTGIHLGQTSDKEKDTLINLETILHKRIIGQDEAVTSISQSLRRSRAGISKGNRPIGSFLFLGPTGVGKTETAKALSDVFFGEHTPLVRFDMSEYSSSQAIALLIGDGSSSSAGVMTTSLKEHQYGVLLLDEFEKASHDVHNLFLQILDEGFFTSGDGTKINVRNFIIIATSNAGSDFIINFISDLSSHKQEIIDHIIKENIFKPELVNRFDATILFHPLDADQLSKVTRLQLAGLSTRLREKGIELQITDGLVQAIANHGTDTKFGARPINRAIADIVEEKIAEALIKGEIHSGDTISFTNDLIIAKS